MRAHCSSNKRGSACLLCRKWSQCLHRYKQENKKLPTCRRVSAGALTWQEEIQTSSSTCPVAWILVRLGEGKSMALFRICATPRSISYMKPEREVGAIHSRDTYYALGTGEG